MVEIIDTNTGLAFIRSNWLLTLIFRDFIHLEENEGRREDIWMIWSLAKVGGHSRLMGMLLAEEGGTNMEKIRSIVRAALKSPR